MIAHLATGTVSAVFDCRGGALPVVAHWGAPLGEVSAADLEVLVETADTPRASGGQDAPARCALVPEAVGGFQGRTGLRGHRAGADWITSFSVRDLRVSDRTMVVDAVDEAACLSLRIEVELSESGVLRMRGTTVNDGSCAFTLDGFEMALPVPSHATELLDLTGHWARERHPQRRNLDVGAWVREGRRGRPGHDATLVLVAGTAGFGFRGGEVWGIHVASSGNHVCYAERLPEGAATLGGGEGLAAGELILPRGAAYTSPWLYAVYSGRGLDGVSDAFHRLLRARPTHPAKPRPVVLNTWEAVYFNHDLRRLRDLADAAAEVGIERFVLDDGWFRGRRDDRAGLGDWFVDERVWPDGLGPLVDHVRGKGMEFGLWVEPEMVNEDSDLYRAHPDWVLGPRARVLPPRSRNQQVLDLAVPEAYDYVLERLDDLLTTYEISFLKWDHNRDLVAAGHRGRAGFHRQTLAVHRLIDELRARHPGLEVESCAGGGGRVDLETLSRTDRVWASDANDALERQTIQRWTGVLLPPELVGAHIGPPTAHVTGRTQTLSFRFATAIFGHLGVEWDIASASPLERAELATAIGCYKKARSLLHRGETVRVDHPDPAAFVHGVVAHDRSAALYAYVQLTSSDRLTPASMRLPGLAPDRRYRVSVVEATAPPRTTGPWAPWRTRSLPGRVLSDVGVQPPPLCPEQAWLVELAALD